MPDEPLPALSVGETQFGDTSLFVVAFMDGEVEVLRINHDLTVTVHPDVERAARGFWNAVSTLRPAIWPGAESAEALRAATERAERLATALRSVRREHAVVEGDPYYSCAYRPPGSDDYDERFDYCDCGALEANAIIDAALADPGDPVSPPVHTP